VLGGYPFWGLLYTILNVKASHPHEGLYALKPPNMNEGGSLSEHVRTCEALCMCLFFIKVSFEKIEHIRVLIGIKFSKVFCFVFEHTSPTSKIHLLVEGAHVDRCWAILSFFKSFIGSARFQKTFWDSPWFFRL